MQELGILTRNTINRKIQNCKSKEKLRSRNEIERGIYVCNLVLKVLDTLDRCHHLRGVFISLGVWNLDQSAIYIILLKF